MTCVPGAGSEIDDQAVLAAVREVLDGEVDRVAHPGPRPDDVEGWHPMTGPASEPGAPGHPVYDPQAWRWFRLQHVALLPGLVLVDFTWQDPATPDLRYLAPLLVPDGASVGAPRVASSVRSAMRLLLAPGWRERVERTWLGSDTVIVRRSQRLRDLMDRMHDETWTQPRPPT